MNYEKDSAVDQAISTKNHSHNLTQNLKGILTHFLKILYRFQDVCGEPSTSVNFARHIPRTEHLTPVICGVH